MPFIAGQYTATYTAPSGSPLSIGQTATGLSLEHSVAVRQITGDQGAETVQDGVYRGTNVFAQYTLIEYNAAATGKVMWPYGTTYLTSGIVGVLVKALAGSLIMTALTGTPAAVSAAPATITMLDAILAEGYPVSLLFAPDLREVPIRQRIYPTYSSSTWVYGTTT